MIPEAKLEKAVTAYKNGANVADLAATIGCSMMALYKNFAKRMTPKEFEAVKKANKTAAAQKLWQNGIYRAKVTRRSRSAIQTDAVQRAKRAANKKSWARDYDSRVDAITTSLQRSSVRRRIGRGVSDARKDPEVAQRYAQARAAQAHRESKPERLVRDAFRKPHRDVAMFGRAWDLAFPDRKVFIEVQGCYHHACRQCGYENTTGIRFRDAKKRLIAELQGWQVVYVWEHDLPMVLKNPERWLTRQVV